jgi:nucleoside-diphosphate-sugar epimerase
VIFIIGGNGFIGSAYTRYCIKNDIEHVIIHRSNYDEMMGSSCDVLINANGNSKKFLSKNNPIEDFDLSVTSVRRSLIDFNYSRYVFLSSCDVYPDSTSMHSTLESSTLDTKSQSPYGFHKFLAEQCVQHAAKDWLIIRQGGFVGENLLKNSVYDVLNGVKLWLKPDSKFQFINTDISASLVFDLVDKNISNQIFNLTAIGTISINDMQVLANKNLPVDAAASTVTCEISTEKISQYISLPETFATVKRFIESY